MRQLPLDLGHVPAQSLSEFRTGRNQALMAWLLAWPHAGEVHRPTYLWGAPGSGKTHLLFGLASHAQAQGWSVMLLGRRGFQTWDAPDPEAPSLLLLDDCQALDEQQQHWAFNLFIECATHVGTLAIVAAGRMPPVDLPVREDLRTRLGWGLIFALEPLDEAGVSEALMQECQRRGVKVAEGVIPYLLTHFSRDLGFLMALIDRLDRFALAQQRALTVPLLKDMLALETS
jgi:DnaA-homolog protein